MNFFSIKDVEKLTGIRAHTIRMWEQRYHFLKPRRTPSNIRYYDAEDLKVLLNVALLNRYGIKVSKIDRFTEREIADRVLDLGRKQGAFDVRLMELLGFVSSMDIAGFEQFLDSVIQSEGFEPTMTRLVFPLLERTGVLWTTNSIIPAQEHLLSNIIHRKFMVAIDGLPRPREARPVFLLFLPEGEFHDLGLLYVQYLLRLAGFHDVYLGANMPTTDLLPVVRAFRPDYLYMHLTGNFGGSTVDRWVADVRHAAPGIPLILSGSGAGVAGKPSDNQLIVLESIDALRHFIDSVH
jgi:DNA-binding transcriptional MerR regulator